MNTPEDEAEDAELILRQAARRGLGPRPGLRAVSALLWSAFVGGVLMTTVWLFIDPEWHQEPLSFQRLAMTFALSVLLALVPAVMMLALNCAKSRDQDS